MITASRRNRMLRAVTGLARNSLTPRSRSLAVAIAPRLVTNQVQVACAACVDGLGIARVLHYQVAEPLAAGQLVRLLRDFEPADLPVQIVYPHARLLSPRVRQFID